MNGINEQIKHAGSEAEIEHLLQKGKGQVGASQRTLNRRNRLVQKRRQQLKRNERQ